MTRDDLIKMCDAKHNTEMNRAQERGVFIESMGDEDVEMYAPNYVKEAYDKLTDEEKTRFCSELMLQMFEMLEESPDWGFGELMRQTIRCIEDDGDDVMDLAKERE